nr:aminotransferase class I/II-fold pyridoxal phosphate-dependent enzyme [Sneathiella glossodoripedis]
MCPTYAEHAKCWSDHGHKIIEVSDLDKIPSTTDIAVVVSPNNPTGKEYDKTDLLRLAKNLKARNGFLVLDEAFGDVSDQTTPTTGLRLEGIVALKSFGKFFGLAGLRLGFAIGDTEIITKLHAALGPWAVSGIPMEVAIKAFCDTQWISSTRKTLANNRARLEQLLIQSGFNIAGGTSLFTYAQHPQAEQIFNLLCRAHILTRPFEHSPEKLRFGHPATEAEWDRLQNALKDA